MYYNRYIIFHRREIFYYFLNIFFSGFIVPSFQTNQFDYFDMTLTNLKFLKEGAAGGASLNYLTSAVRKRSAHIKWKAFKARRTVACRSFHWLETSLWAVTLRLPRRVSREQWMVSEKRGASYASFRNREACELPAHKLRRMYLRTKLRDFHAAHYILIRCYNFCPENRALFSRLRESCTESIFL